MKRNSKRRSTRSREVDVEASLTNEVSELVHPIASTPSEPVRIKKVETNPIGTRQQKRSSSSRQFDPKQIKIKFDRNNNVVISDALQCSSKRPSSSRGVDAHFKERRVSARNLYQRCVSLQKEKEVSHEERLRLQNRVSMLKKELQRALRQKARKQRKEEQLEIMHREQQQTKSQLDKIKQQRQKKVLQNRKRFAKRNEKMKSTLEQRRSETLVYKQQLARNARYQSEIREKVSKRASEREYVRKVKMRNKIRASQHNLGSKKEQHINEMLSRLGSEYEARAEDSQKEIEKEQRTSTVLNAQVDALAEMLKHMNQHGQLPDVSLVETVTVEQL